MTAKSKALKPTITTPSQSRPGTPSRSSSSFYGSSSSQGRARSRSHLPQPKVLPFPDIPVRPISNENSRSSSPLHSPAPTRRSSHQDARQMSAHTSSAMVATESNESLGSTRGILLASPPSSFSPPRSVNISTPSIAIDANEGGRSTNAGPSRARALTSPHAPRPILVPSSSSTTPHDDAFDSMPLTPPTFSVSSRPSSLPTAPASRQPSSPPEIMRPPQPVKKPSLPISTATRHLQITPGPPPNILGDHLYQSFLTGACADVRIWVKKWGVGWKVHKMVLVQAGFFHTMFLGGFSETSGQLSSTYSAESIPILESDSWRGENLELKFDDSNITRAAFEICLSRLYAPFPHLHFPVTLLPTPSNPLTPSFPAGLDRPSLKKIYGELPPRTHLATPRLLLSLLATSIYLGHGTLIREVLSMILRTVGPSTIRRYLAFAVGDGIGDEEWPNQTEECAKGLEDLAEPVSVVKSATEHAPSIPGSLEVQSQTASPNPNNSAGDEEGKVGHAAPSSDPIGDTTPTVRHTSQMPDSATEDNDCDAHIEATSDIAHEMPHFYGFASNKIGEACICWLARWGVDVLDLECSVPTQGADSQPRVWSHGGLPAKFLRAVLSSDSFFVRDEMERYNVARRALDLRRKGWERDMEDRGDLSLAEDSDSQGDEEWNEWEEDEDELIQVFEDGIYYTHMTFDDLSFIAADIDPATALPYAPLSILQAAHWSAADLRNRILSRGLDTTDEPELGISSTVSNILTSQTRRRRVTPKSRTTSGSRFASQDGSYAPVGTSSETPSIGTMERFHPVPTDDTHRIGAGGLLFLDASGSQQTPLPGLAGLPDFGPETNSMLENSYSVEGKNTKFRPPPQGEKTNFGLQRGCKTMAEMLDEYSSTLSTLNLKSQYSRLRGRGIGSKSMDNIPEDVDSGERFTKLEPFRFSVEFWGVDHLAEKERLYSETHFYAGSWFNVYVQTIKKKDKGTQLGIYLHRQNPNEPLPTPSSPSRTAHGQDVSQKANVGGTSRGRMTQDGVASSLGDTPLSPALMRTMSVPPVGMGSPNARSELRSPVTPRTAPLPADSANGVNGLYKDERRVTKAYFSISCASALGTALIRFSSAPDTFTLSQSWGWKSSALRSEEYLTSLGQRDASGDNLEEGVLGWVGEVDDVGSGLGGPREGSLRATVVVGVI